MSLRSIAESVLSMALENTDLNGRGVTLTAPDGTSQPLTGNTNDIGAAIDPETGAIVSGRSASVALRISSIYAAGFTSLPKRVADKTAPPWRVDYIGDDGVTYNFSVSSSMPDRSAGVIVLMLEGYTP